MQAISWGFPMVFVTHLQPSICRLWYVCYAIWNWTKRKYQRSRVTTQIHLNPVLLPFCSSFISWVVYWINASHMVFLELSIYHGETAMSLLQLTARDAQSCTYPFNSADSPCGDYQRAWHHAVGPGNLCILGYRLNLPTYPTMPITRNSELNLSLPLESWVGGRSKITRKMQWNKLAHGFIDSYSHVFCRCWMANDGEACDMCEMLLFGYSPQRRRTISDK